MTAYQWKVIVKSNSDRGGLGDMHEKRRSKTYIIEAIILLLSMGIGGCGRETEDTDALILVEQEAE